MNSNKNRKLFFDFLFTYLFLFLQTAAWWTTEDCPGIDAGIKTGFLLASAKQHLLKPSITASDFHILHTRESATLPVNRHASMHSSPHTALVKTMASRYGFDYCGIAKAGPLDEDARRLENWLKQGLHGNMQYMENYFDLRIDPTKLVPGARSVITLLKNYFPPQEAATEHKISKYAYGTDYHTVIKAQLKSMMAELQEKVGDFTGRGFVDSAPVLERSWAQRSGLGWIGRNGNLITKGNGSFFFIATLITDLELVADDPFAKDYCGNCRRCIDACPTEAINEDKVISGNKCISYFTIELREEIIPGEMKGKFDNWMFGCDTCQDVCPWNRFSKPHQEEGFSPIPEILNLSTAEWEQLSEQAFRRIFKQSPLSRSKYKGIQRNLRFLKP